MNSHPRSYGKIFPFPIYRRVLVVFLLVIGFIGCSSESKKKDKSKIPEVQEVEKISFKSDRKPLKKWSQSLSKAVHQDKDDLADIIGEMTVVKKDPRRIRSRFYNKARHLRRIHRRKMNHLREKFKKRQKKELKGFNKNQKKQKETFKSKNDSTSDRREVVREFHTKLYENRKEFISQQRAERDEFNLVWRDANTDFHNYIRDRSKEFSYEYRLYSKKYHEMKKEKREEAKRSSMKIQRTQERTAQEGLSDEDQSIFQKMNQLPTQSLTSDE